MDIYLDQAQQIKLLLNDVKQWNNYRHDNPLFSPDLRGVNLSGKNLTRADLSRADFSGAVLLGTNLTKTKLRQSNLTGTRLNKANFEFADLFAADLTAAKLHEANLSRSTLILSSFVQAELPNASLQEASLFQANFNETNLFGTNFSQSKLLSTVFAGVDLRNSINLEHITHVGPSRISLDTLIKSDFKIPDLFLEGAGVPRKIIDYLPSFKSLPIQYYSCFISFSHKDEAFAKRLFEGLKSESIQVWYAPEEMKAGRLLHEQIDSAIRLHDKLLLVLSENSMKSDWVNTEIYKARKKEKKTGKRVLFPISIVPHEQVVDWECFDADNGMDMARDIRQYYIPDFSNWKDHDTFQAEFEKLVRDLQASEESE